MNRSPLLEQPAPPILRTEQLRAVERAHARAPLMERAGAAAAREAMALIGTSRLPPLVVCGPGNNGGDGFVVARVLRQAGLDPVVVFVGDEQQLPADARAALAAWRAAGGRTESDIPPQRMYSLAVDALFGIGVRRPLLGRHAALVEHINALPCPVLALDIPSGLDADTGVVHGCAVRATHTATFIALKPGLLTLDGPDHCGQTSVHDLEISLQLQDPAAGRAVAPVLFASALKRRPRNCHKGSMGSVAVIGGAPGMSGALLLAARAALRAGAGRVYASFIEGAPNAVDPQQPELMLRDAGELLTAGLATVLAVGPGLGRSAAAADILLSSIEAPLPLVLDADALNLLADHPVFAAKIARRAGVTLLTPHPAEAARLLGCGTAEVLADRVAAALELARRHRAGVVLKGNGSIVALASGAWFINTSGNPGMASAGMGDVLTGIAAALLAQGWSYEHALLGAVHLHGAAADHLVAEGVGPIGLVASEVIEAARFMLNQWVRAADPQQD